MWAIHRWMVQRRIVSVYGITRLQQATLHLSAHHSKLVGESVPSPLSTTLSAGSVLV